jgi:hypothetical protein
MVVHVQARMRGTQGPFGKINLLVDEPFRWVVLPATLCRELGIETPAVDRVVTPSGETPDCETGIALIERPEGKGQRLSENSIWS